MHITSNLHPEQRGTPRVTITRRDHSAGEYHNEFSTWKITIAVGDEVHEVSVFCNEDERLFLDANHPAIERAGE